MKKKFVPFNISEASFGLGTAFYPDQQPRETWTAYADLMAKANISFVRLAEFAWDKLEPEEGKFDFSWLDEVIELLWEKKIKVMLCTPCASPPIWLCEKYNIYPTLENGKVFPFGLRRYVCPNSTDFSKMSSKIITAMARHYADDPRVMGWQIDNEVGHPFCFCPHCLALFQKWCKKNYRTIENFNDSIETHFLGQTYQSFDQIQFPNDFKHTAMRLLYHKFYSESVVNCFGRHADLLRQNGVKVSITTNYMITWYGYDHEQMAKHFDYSSGDAYFSDKQERTLFGNRFDSLAFANAFINGIKLGTGFAYNEFRAGKMESMPLPGDVKFFAKSAFAAGAGHVVLFRFDTCPSGCERDFFGIVRRLPHPGRCYDEVCELGKEVKVLAEKLKGTSAPVPQTAILYSFLTQYDIGHFPPCKELKDDANSGNGYPSFLSRHLEALLRCGERSDIVFPECDFSKYKVIIAPALLVLEKNLARKIREYVEAGGIFLMLPLSGIYDENGKLFPTGAPGLLNDVFGISVVDYGQKFEGETIHFKAKSKKYPTFEIGGWMDEITPISKETKILGSYDSRFKLNCAAFTCHTYGKGRAFYLGSWPKDAEQLVQFYRAFCKDIGVDLLDAGLPPGLQHFQRIGSGKAFDFYINPTESSIRFHRKEIPPHDMLIESRQGEDYV